MKQRFFLGILAVGLFLCVCMCAETARSVLLMQTKKVIVIDPGHGGFDPGKVGVTGVLEKEINLKIALKLKEILEKKQYKIIMTRTEDKGLYEEGDSNKKRTDLRNRVEIINQSEAIMAVSIHQNSFSDGSSFGTQVFYHGASEDGKKIANLLQETIKSKIADGNHRVAKANESYYMLKKTKCPLVIVECGFLSNAKEEQLLSTEEYQKKMAEAISEGILLYLK